MDEDDAMRARVSGKEAVARKTVWTLTVREARLRCVAEPLMYVVQLRNPDKGWQTVKAGKDANKLLAYTMSQPSLQKMLLELPVLV
jgi:hypothetical protein